MYLCSSFSFATWCALDVYSSLSEKSQKGEYYAYCIMCAHESIQEDYEEVCSGGGGRCKTEVLGVRGWPLYDGGNRNLDLY
ncbi:unnamed protein product [Ixodes persulcatus]